MGKIVVQNENYYVVQGWMRNILDLRGNALDIYAIIYGFSQVSHQEFTASINYLCEWLGASRPTVINTLKDLVDRGYLTKESNEINGVIYNRYTAITPDFTGGKEILLPQSKNFTGGGKEILPNNINNNIEDKDPLPTVEGEQAPSSKKKQSYAEILSAEDNKYVKEALEKFLHSCRGKNYTPKVTTVADFAKVLRENAGEDPVLAMAIVDQSIDNGWKALYPLKKYGKPKKATAVSKKWNGETAKDEVGKELVY